MLADIPRIVLKLPGDFSFRKYIIALIKFMNKVSKYGGRVSEY